MIENVIKNKKNNFFLELFEKKRKKIEQKKCIEYFEQKKIQNFRFVSLLNFRWSVMQGSNLRPSGPKPDALPGCANHRTSLTNFKWSVMQGSNLRPSGPKPDALPGCANHRTMSIIGILPFTVNNFFGFL